MLEPLANNIKQQQQHVLLRCSLCRICTAMVALLLVAQLTCNLSTSSSPSHIQWLHQLLLYHSHQPTPPGYGDLSTILEHTSKQEVCSPFVHGISDTALLKKAAAAAAAASSSPGSPNHILASSPPRIAFLFLVKGPIPHEALWRRFFSEGHDLHSIYVHAKPSFRFSPHSLFHCKEIASRRVSRFSFNVVDAMRRLLAHALLDTHANNQWFVFLCESAIPVRSFAYTYDYLMGSKLSYVQAFEPSAEYYSWDTMPEFPKQNLRKGEMWMALRRKHAVMVVSDTKLSKKFQQKCKRSVRVCTPDEQYIQTLLSLKDPRGIANRTVMYVDWSKADLEKGSPFSHTKRDICSRLIAKIQGRVTHLRNMRARYQAVVYTASGNISTPHGYDDGRGRGSRRCCQGCVCLLFARKFSGGSTASLAKLPARVLGY